ncbi:MAG: nucleotidyltransferase [Solirubrobacterales bacterium]
MATEISHDIDALVETAKRAIAALEAEGIPYLLGGGLGCWALGGPPSSNDVDLMLRREDAEPALAALEAAGFRGERPPEQWLFKAWEEREQADGGEVLIDLIFEPSGLEITDAVLARGSTVGIGGMDARVMDLDEIFVTKLMSIDEHACDYEGHLAIARALREKLDWRRLREETAASPFATAFFTLADGLGISLDAPGAGAAGASSTAADAAAR